MDMSAAFFSSVVKNAPGADFVFDHFHMVKLMNEAVDKVRRDVCWDEKDKDVKRAIKGTKWLFMGNSENLKDMEKKLK